MTYKTTSACEKGHKMFHIIHISKVNNNVYVCNYMTDRHVQAWFKVSVSAADSAGTETDRSRRLGSDSDDTRKTLHRMSKKL